MLEGKQVEKWLIQSATVAAATRKLSMASVLTSRMRKEAAEYGVENYEKFIADMQAAPERYDEITEREREFYDRVNSLGAWTIVASCAKPYITMDEWLTLSEDTVNALATAAQEQNPQWFAPSASEEKKTPKKRKRR